MVTLATTTYLKSNVAVVVEDEGVCRPIGLIDIGDMVKGICPPKCQCVRRNDGGDDGNDGDIDDDGDVNPPEPVICGGRCGRRGKGICQRRDIAKFSKIIPGRCPPLCHCVKDSLIEMKMVME